MLLSSDCSCSLLPLVPLEFFAIDAMDSSAKVFLAIVPFCWSGKSFCAEDALDTLPSLATLDALLTDRRRCFHTCNGGGSGKAVGRGVVLRRGTNPVEEADCDRDGGLESAFWAVVDCAYASVGTDAVVGGVVLHARSIAVSLDTITWDCSSLIFPPSAVGSSSLSAPVAEVCNRVRKEGKSSCARGTIQL